MDLFEDISGSEGGPPDIRTFRADSFRASFGEDLQALLDVTQWGVGADLGSEYQRIEHEVRDAVAREDVHQQQVREHVFPRLTAASNPPPHAGVHAVAPADLARVHQGILLNGGVEACDGAIQVHDTLPLTIYQLGVSLVSYSGDQGTWRQQLYRRDLRQTSADPVEEVLELLERRSARDRLGRPGADGNSGELFQHALAHYAERAILLRRGRAVWRMGHGNPVTYELLTGGGLLELMVAGTSALRELVEKHQKFVFVGSTPRDRLLLSLGHALRPLEFMIVDTLDHSLHGWFHQGRFTVDATLDWDGEPITPVQWIPRFIDRVGSRIVRGLFRASAMAPAQLFYAHVDHAPLAALIAIADSRLQEQRGFPMLLDMARYVCKTVFSGALDGLAASAYTAAGAPWRYGTPGPSGR